MSYRTELYGAALKGVHDYASATSLVHLSGGSLADYLRGQQEDRAAVVGEIIELIARHEKAESEE